MISTDILIEIPQNSYGISSRSGLFLNYGIEVGAGVIDSDYRGEIKVLLYNHSDNNFKIHRGDKIAQLIIEKIMYPPLLISGNITTTIRGNRGFGSSDYNQQLIRAGKQQLPNDS